MTEVRSYYDTDADYVSITVGELKSGPAFCIEPVSDIIPPPENNIKANESGVIDLDEVPSFYTVISPGGHFCITGSPHKPLEGWYLQFFGFSRICEFLKFDVIEQLFGAQAAQQLRKFSLEASKHRESGGDQLAKARAKGPIRSSDMLWEGISVTVELNQDEASFRASREKVLSDAVQERNKSKYMVPRGLLINE